MISSFRPRLATLLAGATLSLAVAAVTAGSAAAQSFPTDDPVIRRIWQEGMERSQADTLAQVLMDSIGPRLTGSPGMEASQAWLAAMYGSWGIPVRNERYGTWRGWRRGASHIDLVAPRTRSLEGTLLAWSPGTKGKSVTAPAVILPDFADSATFVRWLPQAKGKFVLVSMPQPTCRPDENWEEFATEASFERMKREREAARAAWTERVERTGYALQLGTGTLGRRLDEAGVAGVVASRWSNGWGVNKIFDSKNQRSPSLDLSCEDYGLVYRLAERNQSPQLRVVADAEARGEVPVFNTIAEIKGSERPDEYVVLSAHLDSWDAGSGATDNGTGTVTMLEAMRILKAVYPKPKRTILVGHWSGEEQGLNGSRSFAADHPEIVKGLQALLNQDNGTGRVTTLSMSGLTGAASHFGNWLSKIPTELTSEIDLNTPGVPRGGGSDFAAFLCYGAPGFSLSSLNWSYGTYTWHTNRDTYDKIVMDDLRNNATLTAMLAYLASEDPATMPRDRRVMPLDEQSGQASEWPACQAPARTTAQSTR